MSKKKAPKNLEEHITQALLAVYSAQVRLEASGNQAESDDLDRVVYLIKRLLEQLSNQ